MTSQAQHIDASTVRNTDPTKPTLRLAPNPRSTAPVTGYEGDSPWDDLPNPQLLLITLCQAVLEILAGTRELAQISRWVTESVYGQLLKRMTLVSRARVAAQQPIKRPVFVLDKPRISCPAYGVVEAVVIVRGAERTRSIAMRLEAAGGRWRASAISVL